MSYAETSAETFLKFAKDPKWIGSSESVLAGDLFSMHNESNLLLNPDYYEEKNGRLWHRKRGFLKGSASNASGVEESVIDQLEDWFKNHNSGLAVQISPRMEPNGTHPGYPEEQITIYRIAYTWPTPEDPIQKKILFFTSHQFKAKFRNPEDLRKFIFTEDDKEESVFEILAWLKNISQKRVETSLHGVEEGKVQAQYFARQITSGVPLYQVAAEMQRTGFLGENPIGCGGVTQTPAFSYSENTTPNFDYNQTESWHSGTCRVCGSVTWVGPCSICKPCESKL